MGIFNSAEKTLRGVLAQRETFEVDLMKQRQELKSSIFTMISYLHRTNQDSAIKLWADSSQRIKRLVEMFEECDQVKIL